MSTVGGYLFVQWGVFSTLGDIMINVGGYLEYRAGVQYRGDIMSTVGVILSTVGDVQYRGGYHEYRGGVQYRGGYHPLKFEYHGGYHDICGGIS